MDVAAIVREVVESCRLESDLRACRIVLGGDETRVLLGDPELIRRAIDNVVRNAIRYAPPHTAVDVRITEGKSDTVLSVRDVGPGVPEALLPRLTDPFFRVDAARDANTGGVGLGLAIARRALHLHHGTANDAALGQNQMIGSDQRLCDQGLDRVSLVGGRRI